MLARLSAVSLALAAATGCASAPPPAAAPVAPAPRPAAPGMLVADLCPLQVPGATLATEDVDDGGAIVFRTTGDVADLRRRVRNMADLHGNYRPQLAAMHIEPGLPPADHIVEDVPGGARIVFRPGAQDAGDLASFRAQVATEASKLTTGACPIAMPIATTDRPTPSGRALATR